jgi:septin family protein
MTELNTPFVETEQDKIRQARVKYEWNELDKNLRYLVYFIRRRLRKDWDIVIAISGEEGSGKSTFGILLSSLIDKKWNLLDNMALIPDEKEVVREYCKLNKYQCYMIDEAVRAFYKMNFMTTMTQTLVKMWATERYQNKATLLLIPRFTDLVENFRNHRVKLWIHIIARGKGIAYIRDDDPHNNDPWSIDYARNLKKKWNKKKNLSLLTVEERIEIEKRLPNFLFAFDFPDLDPEFKKLYNKLKTQSRKDVEEYQIGNKKKGESNKMNELRDQRDELIYTMIKEKKTSYKEIQDQFNLKQSQVRRIIKKISDKKEKEKQKIDKIEDETGLHRSLDIALKVEEMKNGR